MLCECGQREATIHEVVIKNGKKVEKHLCEVCAKAGGIEPKAGASVSELISSFVLSSAGIQSGVSVDAPQMPRCPACETGFDAFKQSGQLGCADCYEAFERLLNPLLERSHDGATHHVGRTPRRAHGDAGGGGDRAAAQRLRTEQIRTLRKRLSAALAEERYELAAQIRDEIDRLSGPGGPGRSGGDGDEENGQAGEGP